MTSDSPFGDMKDINAPREIAVHTASKLDQLVSIGNDIIERYHSAVKRIDELRKHHETYTTIEAELVGFELKYDVSDLQELVDAYGNKGDDSETEAITRGIYTGALASVLTKRNNKKGERTHICLNGDGNTFPYLLYFAHTLDEVTIENFRGDYIAACAASYGGTADNIRLANIIGDRAGANIALQKGRVGIVTLANITGNAAGAYIALDNGRADTVTLANITGYGAGADIAANNGRVKIATLANITGDRAGTNIAANNGCVNALLTVNNKGEGHLFDNHATRTITSLNGLANAQQIQSLLDELAQPECAPQHYAQASQQLGKLLREKIR